MIKNKIALLFGLTISSFALATESIVIENKFIINPISDQDIYTDVAYGVSANGIVVVGQANNDAQENRAFIWNNDNNKIIRLGTLSIEQDGESYAIGVSADGSAVIGTATKDTGHLGAFIWRSNDDKMTSLGTLRKDQSGSSIAYAVSSDGTVVVGEADRDNEWKSHAFIWKAKDNKMTSLGTLRKDNSGYSVAYGISADGTVVVGEAENNIGTNAFIWREKDNKMLSLGTLSSDNKGDSNAYGVSADGSVVVGSAVNDYNDTQAFIWHDKDNKMISLGTLKHDNRGSSTAYGISSDGSVVVGEAMDDSQQIQAFTWREDIGIINLGTLTSDNHSSSTAYKVSDDGTIIVGTSEDENYDTHATIWKVKYPASKVNPPNVKIVDINNSEKAMSDTAIRGFKVLDLYQSSLTSLGQTRCQLSMSNYCSGIFSQYNSVNENQRLATGIFGSIRLPAENWIIGGAVNFENSTHLINNYDTNGNVKPGVGIFASYQQSRDNRGLNTELSGSFLKQDLTITRDKKTNTEAGEGNSGIKGYLVSLSTQYGVVITPSVLISPSIALTHHKITRNGYTENVNAEFPATYSKVDNSKTNLKIGVSTHYLFNDLIEIDGDISAAVNLYNKRDDFIGRISSIKAYSYSQGGERDIYLYAKTGINVNITPESTVRASIGWQQTDYNNDAINIGVSYSYHW